jgi:hypothetical protein
MWLPPEKSRQNLGDRKSKTPTSSPVGRKKKKKQKTSQIHHFPVSGSCKRYNTNLTISQDQLAVNKIPTLLTSLGLFSCIGDDPSWCTGLSGMYQ